jgi:sugar O-acyltransferase (sialic acid O-acetyltransferase NeuD family)
MFILGYSGHAFVVLDSIQSENNKVIGYFDCKEVEYNPYGLTYFGSEEETDFKEKVANNAVFPCIGSNSIRKKIISHLEKLNVKQTTVKHKSAIISSASTIGQSSFIGPGAIVNSLAKIGKGCIINSGAIVEHECTIGDFSHIAPGAVLAGNVTVGYETFIGANSVFKQGQKIGNNVIVGAGSVVVCDIPDNETWFGNPAKKIK